ncbi:MAG: AAA family ATPase [Ruminococcus sp.]
MNDIDKARDKLICYINRTGQSQAVIAKKIGISPTTVSQFLSETYTGDNAEIASKIESFIYLQAMREHYAKAPSFTDKLRNTRKITAALDYVYANRCTGVVSGVSGCGKTTALKNYQKIANGVVYVQADATKRSPCSVLKLISKAMGEPCKGTASDTLDKLIDNLTGTDRLIIIDEAQHLTSRAFDTLRALNDRAEVGVIYAGTPDIIKRMTVGRATEEFDQVYSRNGYTCNLENHFTLEEVSILFSEFNLDKTVIEYLFNAASKKGGLRYAVNLFKLASAKASGNIQVHHLKEAVQRVGVGMNVV